MDDLIGKCLRKGNSDAAGAKKIDEEIGIEVVDDQLYEEIVVGDVEDQLYF